MERVVIVGGGYAGLRAAYHLRREGYDLILIDRFEHFLHLTKLHLAARRPLAELQEPFAHLAERFGFEFFHSEISLEQADLPSLSRSRVLDIGERRLGFDHLLLAMGARAYPAPAEPRSPWLDLEHLKTEGLAQRLRDLRESRETPRIAVIGGGATAIQFVFEIGQALDWRAEIQLITQTARLVPSQPQRIHDIILARLQERGVSCFFNSTWQGDHFVFGPTGQTKEINVDLILWLGGVAPWPQLWSTNEFGQILEKPHDNDSALPNIWAAGDNSRFAQGLNSFDAQAAVRKGYVVARNIHHSLVGKPLESYDYQQMGFFVSLGPWDGVGWMLIPLNIWQGLPALAIKEAIEAQFPLMLGGLDTYVD